MELHEGSFRYSAESREKELPYRYAKLVDEVLHKREAVPGGNELTTIDALARALESNSVFKNTVAVHDLSLFTLSLADRQT